MSTEKEHSAAGSKTNPITTPAAAGAARDTIGAREAQMIAALCEAMGGCTTAIRAAASGAPIDAEAVTEPLDWVKQAIDKHERLAASADEAGSPVKLTPEARKALLGMTRAVDHMAEGVALLAQGMRLDGAPRTTGADPFTFLLMADGVVAETLRLLPESGFRSAIVRLWEERDCGG